MDQQSRLSACWSHQACHACITSPHGCGWCPYSATCIPATNPLQPVVSHAGTCPLRAERFELRTRAFGCACSTTTLLSILGTVLATLLALAVLWGVGTAVVRVDRTFGSGTWGGWAVEVKDDGAREQRPWRRANAVARFFGRAARGGTREESEQERVTERSRLLS